MPDLNELVKLFYDSPDGLAQFEAAAGDQVPEPYRRLLEHEHHMTVTVEAYHKSPVDVIVLEKKVTPTHYAREILLVRQSDQRVVQYGIMRVNLNYLEPEVQKEILSESIPLGRVLINHDVHRRIDLKSLWKVTPGEALCEVFGLNASQITYGRTAMIFCNHEPAIELLEIVTPVEEDAA